MSVRRLLLLLFGPVALAACSSQAERSADQLNAAAAQSDPAAAAVLTNEAAAVANGTSEADPSAPGSPAQQALENAGAAQTETPPSPQR